jgi:hypothetical protein
LAASIEAATSAQIESALAIVVATATIAISTTTAAKKTNKSSS